MEQPTTQPPPVTNSEPVSPVVRVTLGSQNVATQGQIFEVDIRVTYEKTEDEAQKPIIFHLYGFKTPAGPDEGFQLYHRRTSSGSSQWEVCDEDESCFMIVDDPDVTVNVTEHEHFICLYPGEAFTMQNRLQDGLWSELPGIVGDEYRYTFKGCTVDWWVWGSKEEHTDTTVQLPCWISGKVKDPADNGGRPKLMIPSSNSVQFKTSE